MVNVTDFVTFLLYINIFTDPVKTLIDFTEQFQNGYSAMKDSDRFWIWNLKLKIKRGLRN